MKIGVYSGTFDPIHNGHIKFAERALAVAKLDKVYFLVEVAPWRKTNPTDHKHRTNMVRLAIADNPRLDVINLDHTKTVTIKNTLPVLKDLFKDSELYMLMGADLWSHAPTWQDFLELKKCMNFIVATRQDAKVNMSQVAFLIINPTTSHISSSAVRQSVDNLQSMVPKSVAQYAIANKLYSTSSDKK